MAVTNSINSIQDIAERTFRIHNAIQAVAAAGEVGVGFTDSSKVEEAAAVLAKARIKKPLFNSQSDWIRNAVINDRWAYHALAMHIELELVHNGSVLWWKGYGRRVDPEHERVQSAHLERPHDVLLRITIGMDSRPFIGLLDGLER